MANLCVQETFINDVYETYTDSKAKLFLNMQKKYGRCVSKVYIDTNSGRKQVGWVFEKKMRYEDSKDEYVREVWVTIHSLP